MKYLTFILSSFVCLSLHTSQANDNLLESVIPDHSIDAYEMARRALPPMEYEKLVATNKPHIILFEHCDYRGRAMVVRAPMDYNSFASTASGDMNDLFSSVLVYNGANFHNPTAKLTPNQLSIIVELPTPLL